MRSRNIKPGFFTNEDLVELPFEYRLLFQGLWMMADALGRLEERPKRIKMNIFPMDDVDIEKGLTALEKSPSSFILRYEQSGTRIIQIRNFEKHQNPHVNEKKKGSTLPAYSEVVQCKSDISTVQVSEQSGGILNPDILNPESRTPSKTQIDLPEEFNKAVELTQKIAGNSLVNQNSKWAEDLLKVSFSTTMPKDLNPSQVLECWVETLDHWGKSDAYLKTTFKNKMAEYHTKQKKVSKTYVAAPEAMHPTDQMEQKLQTMMKSKQWRNRWETDRVIETSDLCKIGPGTVKHETLGIIGLNEWTPIESEAISA